MALNPKDTAVLQDALLACGFTITMNQLMGVMDINRWIVDGPLKHPNLFFDTIVRCLQSRLISDGRDPEVVWADADAQYTLWKRFNALPPPRFFEHSFVNTPADPVGGRISEQQLQNAMGAGLDRIAAHLGYARIQGTRGGPILASFDEGDGHLRERLARVASRSTYSVSEEPGMRLHYRAAGWDETTCSDCLDRFTGETHSCQ